MSGRLSLPSPLRRLAHAFAQRGTACWQSFNASFASVAMAGLLFAASALPALVSAAPEREPETSAKQSRLDFTPKPSAPIGLSYTLGSSPQVGRPLSVTLQVTAERGMSRGRLLLAADEGLVVTMPGTDLVLPDLAAGKSLDIELTVLPLVAERLYLGVNVTFDISGTLATRSIAIPVRLATVGQSTSVSESGKEDDASTAAASTAAAATDAAEDGPPIRSLPAVETLH